VTWHLTGFALSVVGCLAVMSYIRTVTIADRANAKRCVLITKELSALPMTKVPLHGKLQVRCSDLASCRKSSEQNVLTIKYYLSTWCRWL
jgi:hypothetical protein